MVSNRALLLFLFPLIITQFVYILYLRDLSSHEREHLPMPSLLRDYPEIDSWKQCSIDFMGRLGCDCDLKVKGCPRNVVPNVVHYILVNSSELSFVHLVSIRSVLRNQRPDKIVIHCSCSRLTGHLWDKWLANETKIVVKTIPRLRQVFNQRIEGHEWEPWMAADTLRLYVLMVSPEGGGIFLDNDVYLTSSLAKYFVYEMALIRNVDRTNGIIAVGSQVIIAHREARLLRFWLDSLDNKGFLEEWNFVSNNLGQMLDEYPALGGFVHWVPQKLWTLNLEGQGICDMMYLQKSSEWREFEAIHMIGRPQGLSWCLHMPEAEVPHINEHNYKTLETSFGEMVREVL